jgi:hypothetical protein
MEIAACCTDPTALPVDPRGDRPGFTERQLQLIESTRSGFPADLAQTLTPYVDAEVSVSFAGVETLYLWEAAYFWSYPHANALVITRPGKELCLVEVGRGLLSSLLRIPNCPQERDLFTPVVFYSILLACWTRAWTAMTNLEFDTLAYNPDPERLEDLVPALTRMLMFKLEIGVDGHFDGVYFSVPFWLGEDAHTRNGLEAACQNVRRPKPRLGGMRLW